MNQTNAFSGSCLILLTLMLFSCGQEVKVVNQNTKSDPTSTAENINKQRWLVIIPNDLSVGFDGHSELTTAHLDSLYTQLGSHGGGKLYGITIQSNSKKQDIINADISDRNLLEIKGNGFQQGKIKKENRKRDSIFFARKSFFVENTKALMRPKTEQFSDIENALLLARDILKNPSYEQFRKVLFIISDMENDRPPRHGLDPMASIELPKDVKIIICRPSRIVDLEKIFPNGDIETVTTIQDGIHLMFHP